MISCPHAESPCTRWSRCPRAGAVRRHQAAGHPWGRGRPGWEPARQAGGLSRPGLSAATVAAVPRSPPRMRRESGQDDHSPGSPRLRKLLAREGGRVSPGPGSGFNTRPGHTPADLTPQPLHFGLQRVQLSPGDARPSQMLRRSRVVPPFSAFTLQSRQICTPRRRARCVPVSIELRIPAVLWGGSCQVGDWRCRVTLCVPDRLRACLGSDMSPVLPAPAWPPSLA